MKIWLAIILFFGLQTEISAQQVKSIEIEDLERLLSSSDDSLTVLNLWATWCKPCVKEIPHFEKVRKMYSDKPIRFWYLSLDFPDQIETRLKPFVKERMKGARVYLMKNTSYDLWMAKIQPDWQGSIPVTLFFNRKQQKEKFVSGEISEETLIQNIHALL